jgi:integrase
MKPYVFRRGEFWVFRFRETVNESGELKTVQRARKLCPVASVSKEAARHLALKQVKELEKHLPAKPELVVTLGDFVDSVYQPFVKTNKREATARGYADMWAAHCAGRQQISGALLKDVETANVYRWLCQIAAMDKNRIGEPLKRNTLQHIKAFLSGVFRLAKNHGYISGINPVTGVTVPPAPEAGETYAYSLEEIKGMLRVLPEPARTMVATAAFTGLRRSELQGLLWESLGARDKEGNRLLHVTRSIVAGTVQQCKTKASRAMVPLLPSLERILEAHRQSDKGPETGPIFRTSVGTPLAPHNVLGRQILPVLNRCAICKMSEDVHTAKVAHDYQRDGSLPKWHGWHAFRRGLGSNLSALGVNAKTIQAILRHANVETTMAFYIKPRDEDSVRAMAALDSVLCSTCALESAPTADLKMQ